DPTIVRSGAAYVGGINRKPSHPNNGPPRPSLFPMGAYSRLWAVLLGILSLLEASCALNYSFPYGSEKIRGVSLAGWLVIDQWMTPSLFAHTNSSVIDEWTFCQYQDRQTAARALEKHWKTFITEADFAAIAAAGLNHVKIPIGYWAFDVVDGEPYVQGQLPYLMKAVSWAEVHGLKVIIDLFGAPGSQNGYLSIRSAPPSIFYQSMSSPRFQGRHIWTNSTRTVRLAICIRLPLSTQNSFFQSTWQDSQSNIDRTNAIIKRLASMFARHTNVVPVIVPLNEPKTIYNEKIQSVTKQFYYDSYGNIRYPYGTSQSSNLVVMISVGFQSVDFWDNFMPPPKWEGVLLETRYYQIWTDADNALSYTQHIENICKAKSTLSGSLWTVVGEWTTASTDCANGINGRYVGSRYDGTYPGSARVSSCTGLTGNASTFNEGYKTFLRQFWEAQVQTYEAGSQGWLQWVWKAENADDWSYQAGLANGWIPRNPTDYKYPNICQPEA
ncbi:hypothetical protein CVT26_009136, partial [Gymnopilus dilepis]